MPLKTDILSNTEQVSILRGELQDIKSYLDTTAIQLTSFTSVKLNN
jgi:hypothetical protein